MVLPAIMTQLCLSLIEKGCQKVLNMISTISGSLITPSTENMVEKHHSHQGEVVENASFQVKTQTSSHMLSRPGL